MFTSIFSAAHAAAANFLVIGKIGVTELLVILVIVLVIFGPKQLPKLAKTFGKTINSFKAGVQDGLKDDEEEDKKESASAETEKKEEEA